ncbi:hypothetical protein Tco_0204483 [Tanacetum coccineum]
MTVAGIYADNTTGDETASSIQDKVEAAEGVVIQFRVLFTRNETNELSEFTTVIAYKNTLHNCQRITSDSACSNNVIPLEYVGKGPRHYESAQCEDLSLVMCRGSMADAVLWRDEAARWIEYYSGLDRMISNLMHESAVLIADTSATVMSLSTVCYDVVTMSRVSVSRPVTSSVLHSHPTRCYLSNAMPSLSSQHPRVRSGVWFCTYRGAFAVMSRRHPKGAFSLVLHREGAVGFDLGSH